MSMLWRTTAVVVAVLLLLVVAAVLALIFLDWNMARGYAEEFLSGAAGREIRIGHLDVEPGWTTTHVLLRDMRVANAEWASDTPLATADEIRLGVRTWPLLRGQIELPEVILRKPEITAEKAEDGRANWDFAPAAEAAGEVAAPEERTEFPYIGQLVIEDGTLVYRDAGKGLDLQGTIATATGETRGNVEIALEGSLEGQDLAFDFTGASLLDLRERQDPYPFEVSLVAGGTEVHAQGSAMEPVQLEGLDVDLRIAGPSMAEVFPIFGIPLPATAPYSIEGRLRRDGQKWRFDDFLGKVDDSDLGGWVVVDYTPETPFLQADLVSQKLDFHDLGGLIGLQPKAGDEVEVPSGETGLLPETPVDVERLHAMNMDVRLEGEQVNAPSLPINRLDMRFVVEAGRVHVEPLVFYVADGRIAGAVTVSARQDPPSAAADLALSNIDLKPFFEGSDFVEEMGGRFVGRIDIEGAGISLADMLGHADGTLAVGMRDGSISALAVEAVGLDLVEALGLLIEGDTPVGIRCGLVEAVVESGVARFDRAIIDTTDSLLVAQGAADLGAEAMDIQIEAREKDFSLIDAAAPVRIEGPFTDPGVAIGGIDPLPFFEMGQQKDIDCATLLGGLGGMDVEPAAGQAE